MLSFHHSNNLHVAVGDDARLALLSHALVEQHVLAVHQLRVGVAVRIPATLYGVRSKAKNVNEIVMWDEFTLVSKYYSRQGVLVYGQASKAAVQLDKLRRAAQTVA